MSEGFAAVPTWLLRETKVSVHAIAVYAALASRSGGPGSLIFPSVPTIARDSHVSVRTVQKALAELQEAGAIRVEPRRTSKGESMSSIYWLGTTIGKPGGAGTAPRRAGAAPGSAPAAPEVEPPEVEPDEREPTFLTGPRARRPRKRADLDPWNEGFDDEHALDWLNEVLGGLDAIEESTARGMLFDPQHPYVIRNLIEKQRRGER